MTRIGASQAFFNIVAQFNAEKLIRDTRSLNTVMRAVSLDTFEAILKPIDDMILQMDNAINAVKDFGMELGDATVEFEKFYGESENLEQVKDELIAVGESYAFVGTEALAAGSRASQVANLIGRQNVDLLVTQAAILAEISDLSLEEAQRGIIQLNQQAGILYGEMSRQQLMSLGARQQEIVLNENAAKSLDVLNTVANRSVALEGDLVKTMTNFASGAHLAGDSFEFMAAASATLLEAGEEQGTAGRALRMMYARLGGDINGARSKIEALGFQFTDSEGQMKSMQGILEDLHNKGWSQLNPAMKQNIAQTIAGNRHYVRFIKLMENYERVTQLTADAQLRLDSAQEQANKALQSNVRQLQMAETRVQNLKAAIGEGLTPFMIGATQAQGDFLAATEVLTDGLGNFGKVMGRGMQFFRTTEGFVKFGIGLQSIGIGLDMFSSVQRSLHGVEVAMANLHSKQSAFLDYGVTATKKQKNLMQGQLYIQQNINRANKEIQLAKMLMTDSEAQLTRNAERRAQLVEQLRERNADILVKRHELIAIERMRIDMASAEDSMYGQRAARIEYENQMGRELLQIQKDIYTQKLGAEDAYMRQMLADFDVFGNFNEQERRTLKEKNESLREQHTILQQIKAENEAVRALRTFGDDGQEVRGRQGNIQISERERDIMLETVAAQKLKTERALAGITVTESSTQAEREFVAVLQSQRNNLGSLETQLKRQTKNLNLSKSSYNGLMQVIKEVNGEYMQTERSLRIIEAAEKDEEVMKNKLLNVTSAIGRAERYNKGNRAELLKLNLEDAALKQKIAPLLEIINNAEEDRTKQAEKMTEVIQILTTEEKKMSDAMKERRDILAKEYMQSDEFIKDQERSAMAYKSMTMGITSLASVMSGFISGTAGAALSMGMMATQVGQAGYSALKSANEFRKLQMAIYTAQFGITEQTGLMKKGATAALVLSKALLPLVAVGGGLYLYAKRQEEINSQLEKGTQLQQDMNNALNRFQQGATLFGQDDAMAETLGIANYSLEELMNNTDLTAQVFDQLNNNTSDFNDLIQAGVDDARDLLEVIMAIQGASNQAVSQAEFDELVGGLTEGLTGGMLTNLGDRMLAGTRFASVKDRAAFDEFFASIGKDASQGMFDEQLTKQLGDELTTMFTDGASLSEEQMDLLRKALKKDLFMMIEDINSLMVMGADDAEYYGNAVKGAAETAIEPLVGMANEIENLTNEIYEFGGAREELFFGGKYGNVTGSLYKQVVTQGVGTLYHKNEIIMSNNFHGFFNEREAAAKIIAVLDEYIATS